MERSRATSSRAHSVNIPCVNAFAEDCAKNGPIHIVQIDAHLDFVDERHGVTRGHGNPMRRAAEKDYVTGITALGIRNVSSTAKDGYDAARAEAALREGTADLVAFGSSFLANPDLVERFRRGAPLNQPDPETFYQGEERGYTDYPTLDVA